ncbi:MAG: Rnase Y domain-containing protein, partial [Phycisphaerae bacterium]|nr:Rnase Y domain-containing protein [Phycisphaerae bacterium]
MGCDMGDVFTTIPLLAVSGGVLAGSVVGAAVVAVVGTVLGIRMMGGRTLAGARSDAEQLIADARRDGETVKKQAELDFRDQLSKRREKHENEINGERNKIREDERRVGKREDALDRKLDVLATKEKKLEQLEGQLQQRQTAVAAKDKELEESLTRQREQLLQVSHLTEDEARRRVLEEVEKECQHEAGLIVQRELGRAEEEAKERAMRVTLQAIQRYASEHTAASTVSVVDIPSDDMKGRVIGREGRNIRAFEKATGVDVIVDDTPGVVVVSCFDPVRRAVAAQSLHQLI